MATSVNGRVVPLICEQATSWWKIKGTSWSPEAKNNEVVNSLYCCATAATISKLTVILVTVSRTVVTLWFVVDEFVGILEKSGSNDVSTTSAWSFAYEDLFRRFRNTGGCYSCLVFIGEK